MIENSILDIISGTPLEVWVLFCYIIFVGLKATQKQIIFIPKLFIIPFILIGVMIFSERNFSAALYILSLGVGTGIGALSSYDTPIKILKDIKSIEVPGTYLRLIILLLFFCIKYSFGYIEAINSKLTLKYLFLETIAIGLISGYFLGIAACYSYRFYKN